VTDLFDRAAARALGLGLALRPRGRSRFEPETEPPGFAIPDSEPPAAGAMPPTAEATPVVEGRPPRRSAASVAPARSPDRVPSEPQPHSPPPYAADSSGSAADPAVGQNAPPQPPIRASGTSREAVAGALPAPLVVAARAADEPASPPPFAGTEVPVAPRRPSPAVAAPAASLRPVEPPAGTSSQLSALPSRLSASTAAPLPSASASARAAALPRPEPPSATAAVTALTQAIPRPEAPPPAAFAATALTRATAQPDVFRRGSPPPALDTERLVLSTAGQRGEPDRRMRSAPEASGRTVVAARASGPLDGAAGAGTETAPPPVIEVTIGRLEIRAEPAAVSRPAKPFQPHLDLAAYRAQRERGR